MSLWFTSLSSSNCGKYEQDACILSKHSSLDTFEEHGIRSDSHTVPDTIAETIIIQHFTKDHILELRGTRGASRVEKKRQPNRPDQASRDVFAESIAQHR
jgi:ribonuclease BN (tRNA processing enzyme)